MSVKKSSSELGDSLNLLQLSDMTSLLIFANALHKLYRITSLCYFITKPWDGLTDKQQGLVFLDRFLSCYGPVYQWLGKLVS